MLLEGVCLAKTVTEMEANLFGLMLSSGHDQVGRAKNRDRNGQCENVLPAIPPFQESNKVFILYELWWGSLIQLENL